MQTTISNQPSSIKAAQAGVQLQRFVPEPQSRVGLFRDLLRKAADTALGGAKGAIGIDPEYQELLNRQIELQRQMMLISMQSNIEKTQHETRMAPVRNLRAA